MYREQRIHHTKQRLSSFFMLTNSFLFPSCLGNGEYVPSTSGLYSLMVTWNLWTNYIGHPDPFFKYSITSVGIFSRKNFHASSTSSSCTIALGFVDCGFLCRTIFHASLFSLKYVHSILVKGFEEICSNKIFLTMGFVASKNFSKTGYFASPSMKTVFARPLEPFTYQLCVETLSEFSDSFPFLGVLSFVFFALSPFHQITLYLVLMPWSLGRTSWLLSRSCSSRHCLVISVFVVFLVPRIISNCVLWCKHHINR